MKKVWYSAREYIEAPLILYFIAMILIGLGNTFSSENESISLLLEGLRYTGGVIRVFFPLFIVINSIGKRHQDPIPVIGGIASFLILKIATMFMADQSFPAYFYDTNSILSLPILNDLHRYPINMGIFMCLLVIIITINSYKLSRQRFNYGILRFINNDCWFFILVFVFTVLGGFVMSWMLPFFVNYTQSILQWISENSSNPAALFVYGIIERFSELTLLQDLVHDNFWTGILGGNWMGANETMYIGDLYVWSAQLAQRNVLSGTGKYITPYYILNLFMVPALAIGYYCHFSTALERRKLLGLLVVVIAVSLLFGTTLPMEMMLAIISPILLVAVILLTGSAFGVMHVLRVWLGYDFTDSLIYATPGTLTELIRIRPFMSNAAIIRFVIAGVIYALIAILLMFIYFRVLAFDFLEPEKKKIDTKEMIRAFGGIQNIRIIDYTPFSFKVTLWDNEKVNADEVIELGATKIVEGYYYFTVEFGPSSVAIARAMRKELKSYQQVLKYIDTRK